MPARLVATNVRQSFGSTLALGGVSFSVPRGHVHALIGQNGAGKSTLMNVLAGALTPEDGELAIDGVPYRPANPAAARRAGVAMVHQELSLCPHLTVAENIMLGIEPSRFGVVAKTEMHRAAQAALDRVTDAETRAALALDVRVAELAPSAQQLVEIARALALPALRVLILDEPTSSLAAGDVERLFSVLRRLKGTGIAVVYISHFLDEAQRIADEFTVLRDGKTVGGGSMQSADVGSIVEMMVGQRVERLFPRSPRTRGETVVTAHEVGGATLPREASLSLARGEILGIAGLVGAGRTELLRVLFGLDPMSRGKLKVLTLEGPHSPAERWRQGVGFASEDRKQEGLATALSIADNLTLTKLTELGSFGFVVPRRQNEAARRFMASLGIRARDPEQPVLELSGGNQQKVALARLLYHDVDVLLLDEPTRGVDVGSKAQIYELIDALAAKGKAIIVVSSYLPELLGICDRIAVMKKGKLGVSRPVAELDERTLLAEATGA